MDIGPGSDTTALAPRGGVIDIADLPPEFRSKVIAASADVPQHVDFFDVLEEYQCLFPDGTQYVSVKVMNEGDRRRYLNKTNREVRMNAQTREMKMQSAAGDDKHALLKIAITGWNVYKAGRPVPFNEHGLEQALNNWPPAIVDLIEQKVTEVNPWLKGTEDNLPAMKDEYEQLGDRIKQLEDRAAKN